MRQEPTEWYKQKFEEGDKFADFANDVLYANGVIIGMYQSRDRQWSVGESRAGFEIKYDARSSQTGNLWIETAEKSNKDNSRFVPSGIYATDNRWLYLIGNYHALWVFSVVMLRLIEPEYESRQIATSRGFLMPTKDADKYAAKVMKGAELSALPWRPAGRAQ